MSTGAPLPPNPNYQYVPPPPATSGNTVLKIVLIVVGVFVLIGMIVAGIIGIGVYKVSKTMHRNGNGDVSFSTPNGTITTGKSANISAADLGVDVYPGAVSGAGAMNMKTPTGSIVTSVFTSSDPADKVVEFYKDKLGDSASITHNNTGTVLTRGEQNDKDKVMVTVSPHGSTSKIVILHITQTRAS